MCKLTLETGVEFSQDLREALSSPEAVRSAELRVSSTAFLGVHFTRVARFIGVSVLLPGVFWVRF